jgi:molybdopterin biosynthesis enzyme
MIGIAKMFGVVGNYALTGKFVRKTPALSVRVLTAPPQPGSYEIFAIIAAIYAALPLSPSAPTKLVEYIVKYIIAKYGGKPKDAEMALDLARTAVTEMGATSRAHSEMMMKAIDLLAESQRQNARLVASPVGDTCETIAIGSPDRLPILIDRTVKAALNAEQPTEILRETTYEVTISEIDILRRSCKVSLSGDSEEQRYDAEITDPVVQLPGNPYAAAVSEQTALKVKAKVQLRDGDLQKFFISNTVL